MNSTMVINVANLLKTLCVCVYINFKNPTAWFFANDAVSKGWTHLHAVPSAMKIVIINVELF